MFRVSARNAVNLFRSHLHLARPTLKYFMSDTPKPIQQCPNCSYNLMGTSGLSCPECGFDIDLIRKRMIPPGQLLSASSLWFYLLGPHLATALSGFLAIVHPIGKDLFLLNPDEGAVPGMRIT